MRHVPESQPRGEGLIKFLSSGTRTLALHPKSGVGPNHPRSFLRSQPSVASKLSKASISFLSERLRKRRRGVHYTLVRLSILIGRSRVVFVAILVAKLGDHRSCIKCSGTSSGAMARDRGDPKPDQGSCKFESKSVALFLRDEIMREAPHLFCRRRLEHRPHGDFELSQSHCCPRRWP